MAVDPKQTVSQSPASLALPSWIEQYRWPMVGAVAIVTLVVAVIVWTRSGADRANADAFQRLSDARSATDLMTVPSEFPESQAAPLAMMKLAKTQYDQGSFEEALKTYENFSAQYRDHELAEGAELGKIHCLEAMGRTEDALKGFEDFQKTLHFLAPQAVIGHARCLRTLGRLDDARVVYEDYITANPKSPWSPRFKELLDEVANKKSTAGALSAEATEIVAPSAGVTNAPVSKP